jgi:uncharacterized membrane protein
MRHRMVVAVCALLGTLVSSYLLLYKLGVLGELRCVGSGGCERVQLSRWSVMFGVPVAAFGVAGYAGLLGLALWGLSLDQVGRPTASRWIAALSALGVLFSLYLLSIELIDIHAVCLWCSVSGVLIAAIFVASAAGLLGLRRPPAR